MSDGDAPPRAPRRDRAAADPAGHRRAPPGGPGPRRPADRRPRRAAAGSTPSPTWPRCSPRSWVPDLLGWPAEGRDRLLDWAGATFDGLGPLNDRTVAAGHGPHRDDRLRPAAGRERPARRARWRPASSPPPPAGDIEPSQCPMAIIDYLGPSLDTTVERHRQRHVALRHPPRPVAAPARRSQPGASRPSTRSCASSRPISCFSRVAASPTRASTGSTLPEGARLLVSYASANRDERHWDRPDEFDITRESADQLGLRPRRARLRRHGPGPPRGRGHPLRAGRAGRAHRARRAARSASSTTSSARSAPCPSPSIPPREPAGSGGQVGGTVNGRSRHSCPSTAARVPSRPRMVPK